MWHKDRSDESEILICSKCRLWYKRVPIVRCRSSVVPFARQTGHSAACQVAGLSINKVWIDVFVPQATVVWCFVKSDERRQRDKSREREKKTGYSFTVHRAKGALASTGEQNGRHARSVAPNAGGTGHHRGSDDAPKAGGGTGERDYAVRRMGRVLCS